MSDRTSSKTSRLLATALAGSTVPLMVVGSAALAAPASAAPASSTVLTPSSATPAALQAARGTVLHLDRVRPVAAVTPAAARAATTTYTVRRGDTVSHIAARHGLSVSSVLRANGLSTSSVIHPGQTLKLTAAAAAPATKAAKKTPAPAAAASTYTVRHGDSLYRIATQHKTTVGALQSLNGLRSGLIHPGQVLKVSGTAAAATPAPKAATKGASTAAAPATTATYTVKRGDTLSGIASRHGVTLAALLQTNGLQRTSVIKPGQTLRITGSAAAATPKKGASQDLVPSTFLHYTYPAHVVASANENKRALLAAPTPSRAQMESLVRSTAREMGVDPRLALGHAMTESGLNHASVSPANAIGTMQVIPSSGQWASSMVGRQLNLLDPKDNVVAGIAIIRHLQRTSPSVDVGIASYYQGAAGVKRNGMYPDTVQYVAKVKKHMGQF